MRAIRAAGVAAASTRPKQQPPEDEISRLFALMMPERAAKPPCTAAPAVAQAHREVVGRGVHTPREAEVEQERDAILAAIAQDRAQRRRRETAWHVALVMLLLAVALPIVGAGLAKLLLALRLL